tara:strand:- start:1650 stop:1940 length:291 start_codon:yes stop_codon:yes gene_type:complete
MRILKIVKHHPIFEPQLMVGVDADPASTRCAVFNRGSLMAYGSKPVINGFVKFRVPLNHINSEDILVVIFDDTRVFNAAILDGVTPEVIDANLVTI